MQTHGCSVCPLSKNNSPSTFALERAKHLFLAERLEILFTSCAPIIGQKTKTNGLPLSEKVADLFLNFQAPPKLWEQCRWGEHLRRCSTRGGTRVQSELVNKQPKKWEASSYPRCNHCANTHFISRQKPFHIHNVVCSVRNFMATTPDQPFVQKSSTVPGNASAPKVKCKRVLCLVPSFNEN